MATLDQLASLLLTRLTWTSLQAVVLVGIVALLIRLLPRLPAAARCTLWWLAGLQVVLGLGWQAPIRLPLLTPPTRVMHAAPAHLASAADGTTHPAPASTFAPAAKTATATPYTATAPTTSTPWFSAHWRTLLAGLWLLLLLAQLPSLVLQHRRTRRLRRDAKPLPDATLQAQCAQQARALDLRRCPRLRVSPGIASPQVSGFLHPLVLWPAGHTLTPTEAALALAHELAHLKRADLALGWIPALAQRLFFFHPLLRWAMHEYALHREAACDALVLQQQHAAPQDYGRLLLRLGVGHPLHAGLAGASPTFHNLKRRLTMLQQTSDVMPRMRGWLFIALVAAAGVLPYRVVAANHPSHASSTTGTARNHAGQGDAGMLPMPPMPPEPPAPPPSSAALPAPPAPPSAPPPPSPPDYGFNASHVDVDIHSGARQGFALFVGNSVMIDGTDADAAAVKRLHKSGEPMLWLRRGDKAYLIRDKATIERAERIHAPLAELARQQGRLAGHRGELAGRRAGLAARSAALAQTQGELAVEQARLAADAAARQVAAQARAMDVSLRDANANRQADIQRREQDAQQRAADAQRRALQVEQEQLEQRRVALQAKLDKDSQALKSQQATLDKQQQALTQQQQQTRRRTGQSMDKLVHEALAKGLAQDVSRR